MQWELFVFHLTTVSESIILSIFNVGRCLYQTYVVESLNVIGGGINTILGLQPDFWDHSPLLSGKGFPPSPPFRLSKALGLLPHTLSGR